MPSLLEKRSMKAVHFSTPGGAFWIGIKSTEINLLSDCQTAFPATDSNRMLEVS